MTLKNAIKNKKIAEIRKILRETPVSVIADMLEDLSIKDRILYFRLLGTDQQSKIFAQLEPNYQEELVKSFTDKEINEIVGELYADEIADLVGNVPKEFAKKILKNTSKKTRAEVNKILRYSDDQTGSVMTVDIIVLKQAWTIIKAIKFIRLNKDDAEISRYFFVSGVKNKLVGRITTDDLLFSKGTVILKSIMKPISYVYATTNKEKASLQFADQNLSILPVVSAKKEVIGAITADDVIDIVQDAATEDIQKMAGIDSSVYIPYSRISIIKIFKSRVFWLMLLMISATLSQIVLDVFQGFSKKALAGAEITTAIIAILPVISGAAGNAGSQSSTTIIRALATNDISIKDYLKVFWKEMRVSFLIGMALGIANFTRLVVYYLVKRDIGGMHTNWYLMLSMAASLSLFVVIVLAKITGGMLPLLAKKMKLDPAVMAAPLLTTLIDAVSTMIFFGISIGIMVLVI